MCNHTHWVNRPYENAECEIVDDLVEEYTFEDLSVHSYHCTQCKEKFWYSQKGRICEARGISVFDVTQEMIDQDNRERGQDAVL